MLVVAATVCIKDHSLVIVLQTKITTQFTLHVCSDQRPKSKAVFHVDDDGPRWALQQPRKIATRQLARSLLARAHVFLEVSKERRKTVTTTSRNF